MQIRRAGSRVVSFEHAAGSLLVHDLQAADRARSMSNRLQVYVTGDPTYQIPFTSNSSLSDGFHISAALGGGAAHAFLVDTGSVGIVAPRQILGPDYQNFDPSQDIEFQYVSSGNAYLGQWVELPVVLGVPADWDGTGDYPIAHVEVFAVDRPVDFDGGVFGIGFAIGGLADGGPCRNPLLHTTYQGAPLNSGYVISLRGIDVGLNSFNTDGFAFIALSRDGSDEDWLQPIGSIGLSDGVSADAFSADLRILVDSGIPEMILWLSADDAPPNLAIDSAFPAGISVNVSLPAPAQASEPALQYSFVTGDASQRMAPSQVVWHLGNGMNTGRHVLAGADYLYDAAAGRVGFRVLPV
jgi:hypothetical protein